MCVTSLRMFLLRRGPLLGIILQHPDDIDYIRCLFLHANFEDSKRIVAPSLLMALDKDNVQPYFEVPLEDLALQSDKVLMLDHHTEIFIWSGREATAPDHNYKRDQFVQYAMEAIKHRFPQPQIQQFKVTIFTKCDLVKGREFHGKMATVPANPLSQGFTRRTGDLISTAGRARCPTTKQTYGQIF